MHQTWQTRSVSTRTYCSLNTVQCKNDFLKHFSWQKIATEDPYYLDLTIDWSHVFSHFITSPGGGGHSYCRGDADVRLQWPPIFSAAVTQWPRNFGDCLCCHPKTPTFFDEMRALRSLLPKDPLFFALCCHRRLLLFQFIDKLIISAIFHDFFFFAIPAFKALTERSKVTFSPNVP